MNTGKISDKVWALHADIRTDDLFEGIWPIPDGVTLNSYLVKGEKLALIDLVRDWCDAPGCLRDAIAAAGARLEDVAYLVLNHLEPDHTGWLAGFRAICPNAEIVSTKKGLDLVRSFYKIQDGLREVKTGDRLDLGGVALDFVEAPNVHWPETMVSFEAESGTLFSCDAFGSFGALGDRVFDDEFTAEEHERYEAESLRYYANIVSSFSLFVKRAIEKLSPLDVKVVAPSHGIVWRTSPATIIERYARYAAYMDGPAEQRVCVVWGSMYGNTREGLEAALAGLDDEGLPYTLHRVPNEDVSWVLADAYRSAGILIAAPTYEYHLFPPMAYAMNIFERKHVWNRAALRIGSFGWVGGAKKEYDELVAPLKWRQVESVEWAGAPDEATKVVLRERGRELARMVKEML
jgi:flavorubredoxin